ncbi:MAG: methyl-accepting chemotaxis protein [Cyanobacteria bacterium P01_H01_bin.15]
MSQQLPTEDLTPSESAPPQQEILPQNAGLIGDGPSPLTALSFSEGNGRTTSHFVKRVAILLVGLSTIPILLVGGLCFWVTARNWPSPSSSASETAAMPERVRAQMLGVIIIGALLVGGLSAGLSLGFLRSFLRSLTLAHKGIDRLSDDNLDFQLPIGDAGPAGQLISSVNRLARSLKEQRAEQTLTLNKFRQLQNLGFDLASTQELETLYSLSLPSLRQALNCERAAFYRFDQNWDGRIVAESVDPEFPIILKQPVGDPTFDPSDVETYRFRGVQVIHDIYQVGLTDLQIQSMENASVKASLNAPIEVEGELFGILLVHQCSQTRQWTPAERDFFAQVAQQFEGQLARLSFLEQQKMAMSLQREEKEELQRRALELLMQIEPVSQGDLTVRAQVSADEIGTIADSYNATIESLRALVTQVQAATQQVTETSTSNEAAIQSLTQGAVQQTQTIETALHRLSLMTHSIEVVSANAQEAEAFVQKAAETVEMGDLAMNRTVDGIFGIRSTVSETAKKVKQLGESTQKISKVVNLISSFADQTNLLALNASIEAAHAGEEGRGFAVVAEEVRSLARQSAAATADIETVVSQIQSETQAVAAAMEAGTEQVVAGTQLVEDARQNLNQITVASTQLTKLVTAISAAANEQADTSAALTQSMGEVAEVSNQTALETEKVSGSFQNLLVVAGELQTRVGQFRIEV